MAQNINQNLDELKNSITTAKTNLATNLSAKGVQTEPSVTLTQMVENVNSIETGGGGGTGGNLFETIGYTDTPKRLKDGIAYAKELYDSIDMSEPMIEYSGKLSNLPNLVILPCFDLSKMENKHGTQGLFIENKNLEIIPSNLNFDGFSDITNWFGDCWSLQFVPKLATGKVKNISYLFENCFNLKRIEEIDMSGCSHPDNPICLNSYQMPNTQYASLGAYYIFIRNFGKEDRDNTINISEVSFINETRWGDTDTFNGGYADAKQSLIDTFITYSFDRKKNGFRNLIITFHKKVFDRFTEEERKQIEAKGYTLNWR